MQFTNFRFWPESGRSRVFKEISFQHASGLLLGMVAGTPIGVYLVVDTPNDGLTVLLTVTVFAFAGQKGTKGQIC